MWTHGLLGWYRREGRDDLPWRHTSDPWAVLVSEVMLQQTQVGRVLPRWGRFLQRWPAPADLAAAPTAEVLREWRGLGYPRRAVALQRTAAAVADHGWPADEAGLQALPGVGRYTARAMLALSLGAPDTAAVPVDVNIRRVTARAALGTAPHLATADALDAALTAGRPRRASVRDYTYSLFDVGARFCRSRPRCDGCPLQRRCAASGTAFVARPRRQPRYSGSRRELRGAALTVLLDEPHLHGQALQRRVGHLPLAADIAEVRRAVAGLVADGLLAGSVQ